MISILIPVYNFDVTDLVQDLHEQVQNLKENIEIILADDGSKEVWKKKNRTLQNLENVNYEELSQNLGRSAIRNYLSKKAKYEFLLFLDNDMKVIGDDFIENYLRSCHREKVVTGGLLYPDFLPEGNKILHYKVGKNREVKSVSERSKSPYESFLSCNFLVPKSIFRAINFDESLRQYGHEDTLFGMELEKKGIEIVHIENPLVHLGLEPAKVFLSKTEKAIENLCFLNKKTDFSKSKLIRISLKINQLGLNSVVLFFLKRIRWFLLKNLNSSAPNLFFFDLYKLLLFIENLNKKQ